MTRDVRRQPNKERQQRSNVHELSGSYMRSPALQSAEERRGSVAEKTKSRRSKTSKSNVRFASEEKLINPGVSRKRLPRLNPKRAKSDSGMDNRMNQQHSGLTADWRAQTPAQGNSSQAERQEKDAQESKRRAATVQAITEEEQEKWTILGVVAMLLTLRVDYRHWRRFSLVGMLIILPLLVIVLKFGINVYGASRWLSFGSFFSFEPSELTKLVLALYIADWLARKGDQVGTFLYGLVPFIILVGVVLGLVLLENDLGTAIIIAGFATAMFFTAGANIIQFLLAMVCGGLIFLKEAFSSYRFYRIAGFVNPFKDVTGINLQLYQALLALGSGGWFGLGLGNSRQKTGYLPFPYTDSIFPIIGEELGFVGCVVIVMLFLVLAFRGFRLARRTPDLYGALLATGITTWLVLQAMINIGANTGTIPYTGVPLPFISFGGSSLVVSLAAVGVLLNISRYIQEPERPALSLRKKRIGSRDITSMQQSYHSS